MILKFVIQKSYADIYIYSLSNIVVCKNKARLYHFQCKPRACPCYVQYGYLLALLIFTRQFIFLHNHAPIKGWLGQIIK